MEFVMIINVLQGKERALLKAVLLLGICFYAG